MKNLGIIPAPAKPHHFVLGSFTALALVATFIAINTPSASTGNLSDGTLSALSEPVQLAYSEDSSSNLTLASLDAGFTTANIDPLSTEPINDQSRDMIVKSAIQINSIKVHPGKTANSKKTAPANMPESFTEIDPAAELHPETVDIEPQPVKEHPLLAYLDTQAWEIATVKKGDTLSQLFNRFNLESREAYKIASLEEAAPLLKIRPGQKIRLKKTKDGRFGQLHYQLNEFEALNLTSALQLMPRCLIRPCINS